MNRIEEIPAFDSRFPERLREIPESPGCIYLKGRLPDPVEMTVGIIGARDGTEYGKMVARTLAKELSEYGISIISGMAYGIDTAAHEGALLGGGKTYAVLGCGVDICYPAINKKLYSKIQEEGGIISEYPEGSPPLPHHFVARNRLIAGLSDILIVVEAKERSGTFITVDRALEQGKQVFVVPGRITDPLSRGCNRLLMEGASLCLSKEDILSCFSIEAGKDNEKKPNLKGEEKRIYNALDLEGKHIDALYKELGIPLQSLYSVLVKMEIEGYCESFSSSYYRKKKF
ncbi:MAG: DNA-protecting protein DprA [Oribacterium parvum]|uniref:DNA-protecting protein DprA n=1 Tax=Oribacterium parvum TaxID=1501329 RepID=A0A930DQR8_9FIRM|nr:DNA-protecting protein DprA [Oribacterium parvum]